MAGEALRTAKRMSTQRHQPLSEPAATKTIAIAAVLIIPRRKKYRKRQNGVFVRLHVNAIQLRNSRWIFRSRLNNCTMPMR